MPLLGHESVPIAYRHPVLSKCLENDQAAIRKFDK